MVSQSVLELDCNVDDYTIKFPLPAVVRTFLPSKHVTVYEVHPSPYLQNTASSNRIVLLTVHLHTVFRLIMSGDRRSLILHIVLT